MSGPPHCGKSLPAQAGVQASVRSIYPPQFRLGRACPGHPRLGVVETKTWMRGSSPRKTTITCLLRGLHEYQLRNICTNPPLHFRRGDETAGITYADFHNDVLGLGVAVDISVPPW